MKRENRLNSKKTVTVKTAISFILFLAHKNVKTSCAGETEGFEGNTD